MSKKIRPSLTAQILQSKIATKAHTHKSLASKPLERQSTQRSLETFKRKAPTLPNPCVYSARTLRQNFAKHYSTLGRNKMGGS